jgi:hypothetical protein
MAGAAWHERPVPLALSSRPRAPAAGDDGPEAPGIDR